MSERCDLVVLGGGMAGLPTSIHVHPTAIYVHPTLPEVVSSTTGGVHRPS